MILVNIMIRGQLTYLLKSNYMHQFPQIYTRLSCLRKISFTAICPKKSQRSEVDSNVNCEYEREEEEHYQDLVKKENLLPEAGHNVYVIQPYIKWGPNKTGVSTPSLMLEESISLIDSLPNWKCADSVTIPLLNFNKKQLFGSGNFNMLREKIVKTPEITAVFVSVDILHGFQKRELQTAFKVPVYDRYSVVLQIFKDRAKTHEAKLQVLLAEIPYLKASLANLQQGAKGGSSKESGGLPSIGGSGESYFDLQKQLLARKEQKIRLEIEKLEKKRTVLKQQREKKEFPIVAVLGYTNAGKTTLIKALTGDLNLEPKDELFATLDVTAHACTLPCRLPALLIDTVGFISNIPTSLIAAFNSTLRDALDADVLVHLHDVSHPDWKQQAATVNSTLQLLSSDLSQHLVVVANKIDKLHSSELVQLKRECPYDTVFVSAVKGTGLNNLMDAIQHQLLVATDRIVLKVRVPNGGEEYAWLYKEATVICCEEDINDGNYLLMNIIMTRSSFGKLKFRYPHIQVQKSRAGDLR